MDKLVDVFVEWAKSSRHWPLLLLLLVPAAFTGVQSYFDLSVHDTVQHPAFLSAAALAIIVSLGLYAYVAHGDRLRYSRLADRYRDEPRIIVSAAVAWETIKYPTAAGEETRTIVEELESLLDGLPYRIVVLRPAEIARRTPVERDAFRLDGIAEGSGLVLKFAMILTKARVTRLMEDLEKGFQLADGADVGRATLSLPPRRFMPNPFLTSRLELEAALSVEIAAEQRTTLARLVLRYALATTLYFDRNPEAQRVFRDILSVSRLLPAMRDSALGAIYKTTAYYMAGEGRDLAAGQIAIDLAAACDPDDPRLSVMAAYLHLATGDRAKAAAMLADVRAIPDDPARLPSLQGEVYQAAKDFPQAVDAYEAALLDEKNPQYRVRLHLAIALVHGMSDTVDPERRSASMIAHLEEAGAIDSEMAVLPILQGFAWALHGDAANSRAAFDRATALLRDPDDEQLYKFWRARSLNLLSDPDRLAELERLVGDPAACTDARLLVLLARDLLRIETRQDEAIATLERAVELDPTNADGHFWLGFAFYGRSAMTPRTEGDRRREWSQKARKRLREAIRLGSTERSDAHHFLGHLYRDADDAVNAERHWRQAAALDPQSAQPLSAIAGLLVEKGKFGEARQAFADAGARQPKDIDIPLAAGLAWQRAGQLADAEVSYRAAVQLDADSVMAHNNLAFVLFDLDRRDDAAAHWAAAAKLAPDDPDCLAGHAIGLAAAGDHAGAASTYAAAVERDGRFLDPAALRADFLWSDAVCRAAEPLIAAVSRPDS